MERYLEARLESAGHSTREPVQTMLWRDIRDQVEIINPQLTQVIDNINPPDSCRLYRIKYDYGDEIVQRGNLMIPTKEGLTSIRSSEIQSSIREDLCYNYGTNAFCIVLNNSIEVYLDLQHRTIPIYTGGPGGAIGLWAALSRSCNHQPPFLWNISAGSRSVFMLPKISDKVSHNRMTKALGVKVDKPKNYLEHRHVFTALAKNTEMVKPWHCEILAFSKEWFEYFKDPIWQPLHYYFLKSTWDGSEYFRNLYIWNTVFSYIVEKRHLRPNPYLHDTVRHLFGIAVGGMPGFVPLTDDSLGPISDMQTIYDEIYRLKEAMPAIMGPATIRRDSNDPVYYSLNFPTSTVVSPKNNTRANLISEVNEFDDLLSRYVKEIRNPEYNLHHSVLHETIQSTYFKMLHTSPSNDRIMPSTIIPSIDDRFAALSTKFKQQAFPETSSFWNGAVAIIPRQYT